MTVKGQEGVIVGEHESIGTTSPIQGYPDENIRKVWSHVLANGIDRLSARNSTAFAHLVVHAQPHRFIDVVPIAKRALVLHGLGATVHSSGTSWHSAPRRGAISYKGAKLKYSAEQYQVHGGFVMSCTEHGARKRDQCTVTCAQGLRTTDSTDEHPVWLYDVVVGSQGQEKEIPFLELLFRLFWQLFRRS